MPDPGFQQLAERLLDRVRYAVRAGRFSERGLAKAIGYSQPHLHNVLKGKRNLQPDLADALMDALPVSLDELLRPALEPKSPPVDLSPVLDGAIGGGAPFPPQAPAAAQAGDTRLSLEGFDASAAARIDAAETSMWPLIQPGDWVTLDCSPLARVLPDLDCIYALEIEGRSFIARCRMVGDRLLTVTDATRLPVGPPPFVDIEDYPGVVVRGRIIWIDRDLRAGG